MWVRIDRLNGMIVGSRKKKYACPVASKNLRAKRRRSV